MLRAALLFAALSIPADADVIYQTNPPYFGPSGPPGFEVFDGQSVALRFTPERDYTLDTIRLWIMSNDHSQATHFPVRVELRRSTPDGSRPSPFIIDEMSFNVSAIGWDPILESVFSRTHPLLHAGVHYWIVLECDVHIYNPVWNWSDGSVGIIALSGINTANFNEGGEGVVTGTIIEATPACYANCDGSTTSPALTANDFMCFLNAFVNNNARADCDDTGSLTSNDFACFINRYAQACR